jgi:hypothetical protein
MDEQNGGFGATRGSLERERPIDANSFVLPPMRRVPPRFEQAG